MRILVIPDCQVREGVPLEHLEWAGKVICEYLQSRQYSLQHLDDIHR